MAILFHIEPGEQLVVARPDKLARASVFLHNKLKDVGDGETVVLQAHDPLLPADIIKYVLEFLEHGFPTAPASGTNFDADYLAKVCNVLFAYRCVLEQEQAQLLWDALEHKTSSDRSSQTRCWRTTIEKRETAIAERLVISALVLGRQEALERELGVVVWALDSHLNTTVPDLQDLEAMRHEEQGHIFEEIRDQHYKLCAAHNDQRTQRLAHEITRRVKSKHLGELTNTWEANCKAHGELRTHNPYKLIRRFEAAIKGPEPQPPAAPAPTANGQYQPAGPRSFPSDLGGLGQAVGQGINSVFKRRSLAESNLATIEKIFNAVEQKVKTRQKERAMSLMRAREETEAAWRRKLGLPVPSRPPSPKGKEPERGGSHMSPSDSRSPPRQTNGQPPITNGPGNADPLPLQNYGQWGQDQTPAELSSLSTRRVPRQVNHPARPTVQEPQRLLASTSSQRMASTATSLLPTTVDRAGQNNVAGRGSGVHVNGVNGSSNWQVDFDRHADEDSWDYGDDSWRAGPSK